LIFTGFQAQIRSTEETRSEGSSLYIRCPYTAQTTQQQQKVWCRLRNRQCEPLVETKEYSHTNWATKGRVALRDDPRERTVFVTMTELQAEDSGTYACAYYSYRYHLLRTISLIVFKELLKWELDSVSVQCLPSTLSYSMGTKVWCRREDETLCSFMARTDYPSTQLDSKALEDRTLIQDDTQKRTVTITMQKLQAEDSGMYWCALYRSSQLTWLMEVRLSVSKSEYLLAARCGCLQISAPVPFSNGNTFILLSGVLSILFLLALISLVTLYVRRCKQLKRTGNREEEGTYEKPGDTAQPDSYERLESPRDNSKDLKYVTLNFKSRLSPEDPLYCNVELSEAHRKPKDENVEYAIIAFK
ncbi:PIGR protein, partial [Eolophus roseicapillus]|nr:PIGR protein [Eolophus roseicapilla]